VSELHEEVLAERTRTMFECLGRQTSMSTFYLAGGTAVALHLGHRISEDLDLFTERPWSFETIAPALAVCGPVVVDRQEAGTFVGSVGGVRVSLFHYPYVVIEEPVPTRFGLPVAGLTDLGCMKLVAVAQRGSRKDFVDLYHLGAAGYSIRELLALLSRKMPGVEFNPVHILRSLAYFEDAEAEPDPVMLVPYEWATVREYCIAEAGALLEEILAG
jgi:hypothetical protein